MQGKRTAPRPDAALRTDFIINSETQFAAKSRKDYLGAFLPREYISDAALRISAYKDLATVRTLKEADNLLRAWEDRFGPAPETVRHLLDSHKIKILASHANISMVEISGPFPCRERGCGRNTKPRIRQTAPAAFHQICFSLPLESSFFRIISMMPHVLAGAMITSIDHSKFSTFSA